MKCPNCLRAAYGRGTVQRRSGHRAPFTALLRGRCVVACPWDEWFRQ
jgi:hypothetical protein